MGDALVWTWESCDDAHGGGTPGHLVASGSEGSQPSCASSHTPNGVRCCADSEWYGALGLGLGLGLGSGLGLA